MRERASPLDHKLMPPLGFMTEDSGIMEGPDKFGNSVSWSKLGNLSFASPIFANGTVGDGNTWITATEKKSSLSSFSWAKSTDLVPVTGDSSRQSTPSLLNGIPNSPALYSGFRDADVFSSSLPALFNEKLNLSSSIGHRVIMGASHVHEESGDQGIVSLEEMESQTIGNLLPDDEDELLAGITDGLLSNVEEPEDFDLFSSGGGFEMDSDNSQERFGVFMNYHRGFDNFPSGTTTHHGSVNGAGSVIGEHPYGEHPSRTLFVRNINSNVEDSELRVLFEQYGAIRTLYTACKHRGFVMISYYDIRAARSAMRALQNKPLRRRKLDIHFSIPKDNPSDKDINQGTLVVFNLDASVSNDDLRQIFGAYGEVKEIRETPHKRHHKFIEFYDVRAAEAALRALNRSDIAGKRIKLEPSRPGGARRSLMQQLGQELEQEETRVYRQQASSPLTNSPSGHSPIWGQIGSPVQTGSLRGIHHSVGLGMGTIVTGISETLAGTSPGLPLPHHTVGRAGAIGSHLERNNSIEGSHSPGPASRTVKPMTSYHAHSFPDYSNNVMPFYTQSVSVQDGSSLLHGPHDGIEGMNVSRATNGAGSDVSLFEHAPGAGVPSTGPLVHLNETGSLSGPQFLWGNPSNYQCTLPNSSPIIWSTSAMGHAFNPARHGEPQPYGFSGTHGRFINTVLPSHPHHIGSAPPGDPSIIERHLGYFGDSPNTPFLGPGSLGPITSNGNHVFNMSGGHGIMAPSFGSSGGHGSSLSSIMGMMSPRPRTHMFQTGGFPGSFSGSSDVLPERGRIRRTESNNAQDKKQYQLDIERILRGEDTRTTLMIKNIPNKYTSKMLLAAIDEKHRGTYDFLYLPIDFKNKCNVGYAFINMTVPQHIISFYQAFNGKKWEKFNSEKVASLAYARIQGKAALVTHFQNSSLMNEDKRCRPILFHSDGPEAGDQEPFPLGVNIRPRVNHEQNGNSDNFESGASSNKDESVSGSVGSTSGLIVSSSPEKD